MSGPRNRRRRDAGGLAVVGSILALVLAACSTAPPVPRTAPVDTAADPRLVARDGDFAVVVPREGDTLARLATLYLGDAGRDWWIAEFNGVTQALAGQELVIPLKAVNAIGVHPDGYQTVAVLCYHRFGAARDKLSVTPNAFAAQLDYLERNQFHVISLAQFQRFLTSGEKLPKRSVVITIDDGYRSTYEIAWPLLKKHDFPATVFLYTDFAGSGAALTWAQMAEMTRSGLVQIAPHSKSHANLTVRLSKESDAQYRERLRREVEVPVDAIAQHLATDSHAYAYPYGDTNAATIDQLGRRKIAMAFTVTAGGNGFFAPPAMLRRTMIFGDDDLAAFAAKLSVFAKLPAP